MQEDDHKYGGLVFEYLRGPIGPVRYENIDQAQYEEEEEAELCSCPYDDHPWEQAE